MEDRCERCNSPAAGMTHTFWSCSKLVEFWSGVCKTLNDAFGNNVQPTAELAIFGVVDPELPLTTTQENAFAFGSLLARRRLVLKWKSPHPPTVSTWLSDLMLFLKLEKIKFHQGVNKDISKTMGSTDFILWNPHHSPSR